MSGILIIIIIIVAVMVFVVFEVLVSMGNAGVNPSKFISDISKTTDHHELKNEMEIKENKSETNDPAQLSEEVKRWRLVAGILFGLVMVCLFVFYRPMRGVSALASYAFWPLVVATVVVSIILHQKEKKHKK